MSNITYPVLNPETPFAFLHPNIANQDELYSYITVASVGGFACNFFSNIDSHYRLLFKCRFNPSTIAYFASIFATLSYIIGCTSFHVGSIGNCQVSSVITGASYTMAVPATAFLFLLRACAVFRWKRAVVFAFGFFWLALLGACFTLPFAVTAAHIGPTSRCIGAGVKPFSSAANIATTVFDTLMLIFISWKLLDNAMVENTFRGRLRAFTGRSALPELSKALLQSGQVYYLIMVIGNIIATIFILSPSVPPVLHGALTTPNLLLMNCMACKVFRDVKFGRINEVACALPSIPHSFPTSLSSSQNSYASDGDKQPPTKIEIFPDLFKSLPSNSNDLKDLEKL